MLALNSIEIRLMPTELPVPESQINPWEDSRLDPSLERVSWWRVNTSRTEVVSRDKENNTVSAWWIEQGFLEEVITKRAQRK